MKPTIVGGKEVHELVDKLKDRKDDDLSIEAAEQLEALSDLVHEYARLCLQATRVLMKRKREENEQRNPEEIN